MAEGRACRLSAVQCLTRVFCRRHQPASARGDLSSDSASVGKRHRGGLYDRRLAGRRRRRILWWHPRLIHAVDVWRDDTQRAAVWNSWDESIATMARHSTTGVEVYCKSALLCRLASWIERVDCGRSMDSASKLALGLVTRSGRGNKAITKYL